MNLNELGTDALQDAVDLDNLPAERGTFPPPPAPGPYGFELSPLTDANFTPTKSEKYGARVTAVFNEAAPLKIVAAGTAPGQVHLGEPFQTRLSNVPRQRGKDETAIASDLDYLNRAFGLKTRPATNVAFATQLKLDAAARKQFDADIEWSWNCNDERDAYFDDGAGGLGPVPDANSPGQNMKGCGAKYRLGSKAKAADPLNKKSGVMTAEVNSETGKLEFPLHITCACGANVRAFGNLGRIREAKLPRA